MLSNEIRKTAKQIKKTAGKKDSFTLTIEPATPDDDQSQITFINSSGKRVKSAYGATKKAEDLFYKAIEDINNGLELMNYSDY